MFDLFIYVASTAADVTACIRGPLANLCAKMQLAAHSRELVPADARANSSAWARISAAASCLLFLFIILLKATLHAVQNWHGRFLRFFFRATLLRPSTVGRTCPGHKDSAAPCQLDPTASHASVQPSSTVRLAAVNRQTLGGKRSGDDESDGEDNDRGKRLRVSERDSKLRCPFKAHDPENPGYETCGAYRTWSRLREHLLDRKHKPRDRCAICGKTFFNDGEWELHTSAQTCEWSPRALETPFWVERDQAERIRKLSTQGCKTESFLEMYRKVYAILFGSEIAPGRTAEGHPTWSPHFEHTGEFGVDNGLQQPWNILKRTTADLLDMQDVPQDGTMQQVIDCVASYLRKRDQAHVIQNEIEAGEPAAAGYLGFDEEVTEYWIPTASPPEGLVPQASGPHGYAAGDLEGQLDDSLALSALSTYLQDSEGTGNPSPPISFDPAQASSAGHSIKEDNYDTRCVNPALLQRKDAHHTPLHVPDSSFPAVRPFPTSTTLAPDSTASQASEATILGSSPGRTPKDSDY